MWARPGIKSRSQSVSSCELKKQEKRDSRWEPQASQNSVLPSPEPLSSGHQGGMQLWGEEWIDYDMLAGRTDVQGWPVRMWLFLLLPFYWGFSRPLMRQPRSQVTWAVLHTRGCGSWDFFSSKRRNNKNILEKSCAMSQDCWLQIPQWRPPRLPASVPAGASHGSYTSAISPALNWRAKEEIVCAIAFLCEVPLLNGGCGLSHDPARTGSSILLYLVALLNQVMERWQSVGDFGVPQMIAFLTVVFTYCCFTEKKSVCSSIAGDKCKKAGPWDVGWVLNCPSSYVLSEQGFNVIVTSSSDKVFNIFNGPVWTHRTLLIQYLQLSTTVILSHTLFITSTASGAVSIYNWGNRLSPYSFSTVPLLSNSIKHPW